jgi:hypothetical protein
MLKLKILAIVPCFAHQYRLGVRVRGWLRVRVSVYIYVYAKFSTFNNDIFGKFLSVENFLE